MTQEIIKLHQVNFAYQPDKPLLTNINVTIKQGTCVVITGESGCGKTTLIRLINGLIPNFYEGQLSGDIILAGRHTNTMELWEFGQLVGSVFQDSRSQFFTDIVYDEVAFAAENYGMNPEEIKERVHQLLHGFQLINVKEQRLLTLSGGQKQKVAAVAAQSNNAHIYVWDEPSANLDMNSALILKTMIDQLKRQGHTIVIAEHRLYYLVDLLDQLIYMQSGTIKAIWSKDDIKQIAEKHQDYGLRPLSISYQPKIQTVTESTITALDIKNLDVCFHQGKTPLLSNINLQVNQGSVVAIAGENGVGKTTFVKTLCGLIKARSGTIAVDNVVLKPKQRQKQFWLVLQDSDYQLFSDSVLNELLINNNSLEKQARAEKLLKQLGLWQYKDNHPATLSGGQKQRLTLAVGMMNNAKVLVLDEPTSGLDENNMRKVAALIQEVSQQGTTVLIITHDYELMSLACDRLVYFKNKSIYKNIIINEATFPQITELLMLKK